MENLAVHGKILGALGASKGGFARAEVLSPKKRMQIAKKAATVRWRSAQALTIKK